MYHPTKPILMNFNITPITTKKSFVFFLSIFLNFALFAKGDNWSDSKKITDTEFNVSKSCLIYNANPVQPVHNLTQNTFYNTIQSAIAAAVANDVIECSPITYIEKVVIDKSLTLQGTDEINCIIDGTGLGTGSGIVINNGITNVTIKYFTIKNHSGTAPNSYAGIYALGGNNNLSVTHCTLQDNVGGCGFYANGPVNGITLDDLEVFGHTNAFGAARGIVIWNGFKQNISITNCHVYNNNCCGIELQDGTASGIFIDNNNVHDNADNGIGVIGFKAGSGTSNISNNTVANNGRFGIDIRRW